MHPSSTPESRPCPIVAGEEAAGGRGTLDPQFDHFWHKAGTILDKVYHVLHFGHICVAFAHIWIGSDQRPEFNKFDQLRTECNQIWRACDPSDPKRPELWRSSVAGAKYDQLDFGPNKGVQGSDSGEVPEDAVRRIASGLLTSVSPTKSAPERRSIVEIRALSKLFGPNPV